MIPQYIRISGFLSYRDPVELDFSGLDLACISGSNGAGKSSLLDAITWVLFGQARRRDDALINSFAKTADVILDFWYENNLYRVQRVKSFGKTALLEFYVHDADGSWKPLTEHSLRETETRIEQTLRMDYETFTNASFFLQGKADQFSQQRPGDRKRILSSILGLDAWEVYRESTTERRRLQEADLKLVDSRLEEQEEELRQEPERLQRLKELEASLAQWTTLRQTKEVSLESIRRLSASLAEQRRLVEMIAVQMQTSRLRIEQRTSLLSARRSERQSFQEQLAKADEVLAAYQSWQIARKELERWEGTAANFRQYEGQRSAPLLAIQAERSRLEQVQSTLQEQAALAAEWENQLLQLQTELEKTQQQVETFSLQLEQRPNLENELRSLQESQSELQAENRRLKDEMSELKERIEQLKEMSGATCPLCGQPLGPEERLQLIASLESSGKEKGDLYRKNLDQSRLVDERRQKIQTDLVNLQQVEEVLRTSQRQLDQYHDRQRQIEQALEDWHTTGATRLSDVARCLAEESYAQEARAELARIDAALQELGYDVAAHDAARRAEQEGRSSEEGLRQLEVARAALAPLEREIGELEQQLVRDESEFTELEKTHQQAQQRYDESAASTPDLAQAEADLLSIQEQENRTRMQVGGARQAVEVLDSVRARQTELNTRRQEITQRITRLKLLERAFGKDGVPALLIEQALPEIESQANEVLDRLSNGNMSVRFATQKDYKDKNREDKKETLDILISDQAGMREYELFSGGEAFRVNFAIRLALSRVLAQRAGARLQTLVIDEGFGSQDAEGRQRLVEAINLVRTDFARVLVITHLEELKDAFPARIEVEKTARGSQVRIVT